MTYTVLTDTMNLTQQQYRGSCGTSVPPQYIYACPAGFTFRSTNRGRIRIYATIPGLPPDSVELVYQ